MNKIHSKKVIDKNSLFCDAEKVFSRGLVKKIQSSGLDFIEDDKDGTYVFDPDGNRYLDCFTNSASYNLGRKNKHIISEFKKAIHETDQGNFVMLSEEKAMFAGRLSNFIPGNLDCVLFTVVRGEAMDGACKLARGYTGRTELITVDGGWYGQTGFALTLSECNDKDQFGSLIPDVTIIPYGDIDAAHQAISKKTAAIVLEPVQVENGCRIAGKEYLQELRRICKSRGTLLILDETQTGFGRTGKKFAYEHADIIPDILIIGEAISGGMFPMTAFIFTKKLKKFFDAHPLIHLCTFGGHDVGCRVAMKALYEYERVSPWKNAHSLGEILYKELRSVMDQFSEYVKSVKGIGLLTSINFTSPELAQRFCLRARDNGIIVARGEVNQSSVIIRPSLTLSQDDAEFIISSVFKAMKEL